VLARIWITAAHLLRSLQNCIRFARVCDLDRQILEWLSSAGISRDSMQRILRRPWRR
jgi:hypothetical protein